jgi:Right handed beta helix region/Protein of unknown function (DUF1565)
MRRFCSNLVMLVIIQTYCVGWVAAAEVYVDASRGEDKQDGLQASPVKSISKAIELARQRKADRIQLAAGRYELSDPLRDLGGLSLSGDLKMPTILSGGRRIAGWKQSGGLLQAEIAGVREGKWKFRELFINGERCPRARTPNAGYFRVAEVGPDKRTSFTFAGNDLKQWHGIENTELVFLHDWSISRIKFARVDEATHRAFFADPVGPKADFFRMDSFESQPRYFVENSPDVLDAPGEWYLDEHSGLLSYRPRPGETADSLEAFAPYLEALVVVRGEPGKLVDSVAFANITFEHCRFDSPAHGYAEGQATNHDPRDGKPSQPNSLIPAALTFDFARGCSFRNCTFRHLGGSGVWFRRECLENKLAHCTLIDIGGNGLNIGETLTRDKVSRSNGVTDCHISRCGQFAFGAVGIWIGIAAESQVAHNEISQLPYTGVSVGWKWDPTPTGAEKNVIENNHIHHVMQTLSDGGGIYTLGRQPGTVLRGNHIHDVPVNLGRAESNGFFIDEGSSELLLESNVIYAIERSPVRFHQALKVSLRSNYLAHADDLPMFRYNSTDPNSMLYDKNERLGDAQGKYAAGNTAADKVIKAAGPRQ